MAHADRLSVALFGLGEAGSLFAADLAKTDVDLRGFDPAPVRTPDGLQRCTDPGEAAEGADVILAFVAEKDMLEAVSQAADRIPKGAIYADCGAGSPGLKRELAKVADNHGFCLVDVGLMAIVPGNGIHTPALASGADAKRFVQVMTPLGMDVTAISGEVGDASLRKLLRSVVVKGLSALIIEALRGADAADCHEWVWENICEQLESADRSFLTRLVEGNKQHSVRRTDEMAASAAMLEELGVKARMTRSTVEVLRRIPEEGIPRLD